MGEANKAGRENVGVSGGFSESQEEVKLPHIIIGQIMKETTIFISNKKHLIQGNS